MKLLAFYFGVLDYTYKKSILFILTMTTYSSCYQFFFKKNSGPDRCCAPGLHQPPSVAEAQAAKPSRAHAKVAHLRLHRATKQQRFIV
jgi:hypothetical protein